MKRNGKKLAIRPTTIRTLTNQEAARVYGASLNGVCQPIYGVGATAGVGCCPTTSGH